MKKQWMIVSVLAAVSVLLSSCADPYYGSGYGAGPYPRNTAEAVVPIVVGAALVGAILSNNNNNDNYYRRSNYGGHHYHSAPPSCW